MGPFVHPVMAFTINMWLSENKGIENCKLVWICLNVRGVHTELVKYMSPYSVLLALCSAIYMTSPTHIKHRSSIASVTKRVLDATLQSMLINKHFSRL